MGNGAISTDWGQPGEEWKRGRKKRPSSACSPAPGSHTSATAPGSIYRRGATPLNFKASLGKLFSNQGDWRYFGSKTL